MGRKPSQKTKQIEQLTQELRDAQNDIAYQRRRKEEAQKELSDKEDRIDRLINQLERNTDQIVQEIHWMRQLVELLCVPTEKLEELQKIREQQTMGVESYSMGRRRF